MSFLVSKNLFLSLAFVGVVSASASAADVSGEDGVLITVDYHTGRSIPNLQFRQTCNIYKNKVDLITRHGGERADFDVKSVETKNVSLTGMDLLLSGLKLDEKIETPNMICDSPGKSIFAFYEGDKISVYDPGGCGRPEIRLSGDFSRVVFDLVSAYCF